VNLTTIPQLARNANRLREVVQVLSKYGLADWLSRLDWSLFKGIFKGGNGQRLATLSHETRIRLALTELGTTFIKLGQMLSTRPDLVGQALAKELSELQANVPADPPAVVRATIEAELSSSCEEIFASFDEKPIASASIGQVHRAVLKTGQPVVVKVQHPGIEHRIRNDLAILAGLAQLAEQYVAESKQYQPMAVAAEFQRMLLRELDFGREERNLQQFAKHFEADPGVRFPRPYPELSTARVLCMDWLEGVPLADAEQLRAAGHDLDQIARRGASVYLEMIFRDGFYHADPHPGNVLALADGVIGMLDCGMVGRLDERLREDFEEILLAIIGRDPQLLTFLIIRVGSIPPELDQAGLGADIADFLSYYGGQALDQFDLAGALNEVTDIIRRYHVLLPTGVALLLKVLVMLEGTSRALSPKFNLIELIQPYQKKLIWRRLSPERHWRKFRQIAREWERLGEMLPRVFTEMLTKMHKGKFEIHLEHERVESSLNRLAFAILSSAIFVGSAMLWRAETQPVFFGIPVLGAIGCGTSFFLGLRLLWSIRRSGHLERRP
jgi:ubiquinone biosynthesis protein